MNASLQPQCNSYGISDIITLRLQWMFQKMGISGREWFSQGHRDWREILPKFVTVAGTKQFQCVNNWYDLLYAYLTEYQFYLQDKIYNIAFCNFTLATFNMSWTLTSLCFYPCCFLFCDDLLSSPLLLSSSVVSANLLKGWLKSYLLLKVPPNLTVHHLKCIPWPRSMISLFLSSIIYKHVDDQ